MIDNTEETVFVPLHQLELFREGFDRDSKCRCSNKASVLYRGYSLHQRDRKSIDNETAVIVLLGNVTIKGELPNYVCIKCEPGWKVISEMSVSAAMSFQNAQSFVHECDDIAAAKMEIGIMDLLLQRVADLLIKHCPIRVEKKY